MESKFNDSKETNEEPLNISEDINLKYFKNFQKGGLEKEIEYNYPKRIHRNTVFSQAISRRMNTEFSYLFNRNTFDANDFLRKKISFYSFQIRKNS